MEGEEPGCCVCVRVYVRGAYKDAGGTVGQRAVRDVGMSSDPADVSRAPIDVVRLVVEHQFKGGGGVEHVAAHRVEHPLQATIKEQLYWNAHTHRKPMPLVTRSGTAALKFNKGWVSVTF